MVRSHVNKSCVKLSTDLQHLCSFHVTNFTMSFLVLGPPDSIHDWTKDADFGLSNQNGPTQLYSNKNWRLLRCQNGKSVFLSLVLILPWRMFELGVAYWFVIGRVARF